MSKLISEEQNQNKAADCSNTAGANTKTAEASDTNIQAGADRNQETESETNTEAKDGKDTQERQSEENEQIREMGSIEFDRSKSRHKIQLLTIIGEIEGHDAVSGNTKATKYEHILPKLAEIEDNDEIEGILILLNTMGGDVEAGLAIAEMIASLSKPTVSLVLGGCHSIGGPLAVSADYSFIVPSGTMIIHPVRSNGMFIGVIQSYRNMERTQDRITRFLADHSKMTQERIEELMLDSTQLVKDVGTMLDGERAVKEGLIDEVGGISTAMQKLYTMIDEYKKDQKPEQEPVLFKNAPEM